MLVEILDAGGDRLRKMHPARDVSAALTACFDQLFGDLASILENPDDRSEAFRQAGAETRMREDEAERLRQTIVDLLEIALEGKIVGQIELANARGVAAAAEVLQKKDIIEVVQIRFGESQFPADMDSNPTAPHTMAGGLTLGEVERMAKRAKEFRKAYIFRGSAPCRAPCLCVHDRVPFRVSETEIDMTRRDLTGDFVIGINTWSWPSEPVDG
jgi:hypothetical protein